MSKHASPKKRNKRHIPIQATVPILFGLTGGQKTELRLPYHLALDTLRRGAGTDDEAHLIFSSLLVAKEIAKLYQQEDQDTVQRGIDAITAVKDRGDDTGKWGISGDQFRAISDALVKLDDLQDASKRREVRDAIAEVLGSAEKTKKKWRKAA